MPKGANEAKKAGDFSGSRDFIKKPPGILFFSLKNDRDQAVVRFLNQHEEIEWVRQWRLHPDARHPYGEKVPCVDQLENGTQDPGYALNLRTTWTGFLPLIWRNAPVYLRDATGKLILDGANNKQITGYQDQVALWEHSYPVYDVLRETESDYRGLMSRDFVVTRIGVAKSNKVTYKIIPYPDPSAPPTAMSQQDTYLAQTQMIDIAALAYVPTYEELATYLNGGVPVDNSMIPNSAQGGVPIQHQTGFQPPSMQPGMPPAPAPPAWPAQQQGGPVAPPAPPAPPVQQPSAPQWTQPPPPVAPPVAPAPQQVPPPQYAPPPVYQPVPGQQQPPAPPAAPPVQNPFL